MASRAQLHGEMIAFLRQHCPVRDQRHLVLLGWMVAGLLLTETVCFDHWKTRLPLGRCLASSWQRRCQRWLANSRVDPERLYSPLILWAIQGWHKSDQTLHLALDTTLLWGEPHLRGGRLGRLPWPSHSAALASLGASQCQRQCSGLDCRAY